MNTSSLTLPQRIRDVISTKGFTLDEHQPHILGERFLMRAITTHSGKKWVLLGTRNSDRTRVVIKISDDSRGIREIHHERVCRTVLQKIKFAYGVFSLPEEILYETQNGVCIAVHRFIEQERPFIERPLAEQFTLALSSFKAQESAHASTYEHERLVTRTFGARWSDTYLRNFEHFKKIINAHDSSVQTQSTLEDASLFLKNNTETIDQYGGFLTHTDFVPHNFRISNGQVYLLDASSLRFGNKYEGWARFLNFMTLYNPPLEKALTTYVKANRTPEETLALKTMRVYRLGEIWAYYVGTLEHSTGNLLALNTARTVFWSSVLRAVLHDSIISEVDIRRYKELRDSLRSEEEKKRQENLH